VWQGERPPELVIRVCRKCESKVESRSQAGERELWMRLRGAGQVMWERGCWGVMREEEMEISSSMLVLADELWGV